MKPLNTLLCLVSLAISLPSVSFALEVNGVKFADQVKMGGKTLSLNGVGLRQATFLNVNVYAGGLYLETPSHSAEAIASSDELKTVELYFLRDVEGEKIKGAWAEGFEKNCKTACEAMKPGIAKLQSLTTDMKKGDVMIFNFYPDHVETKIRGAVVGTIDGKDFSKNMIRCWIGPNPPNAGLKAGMLGIKD